MWSLNQFTVENVFNTGEKQVHNRNEKKEKRMTINSRGNDLCLMKNDVWPNREYVFYTICIADITPFLCSHSYTQSIEPMNLALNWTASIAIDWIVSLCRVICNIYLYIIIRRKLCRLKFQQKEKCVFCIMEDI